MSDDLERRLKDLLADRGRLEPESVEGALDAIDALPPRPARFPRSVVVAAVVMVAVVGVALLTLLRPPDRAAAPITPTADPSSPVSVASQTPSPTPDSSPSLQPPPVWAVSLASHLDCDGPPSTVGSDTLAEPEPFDPGDTPERALANYLIDYPSLPIEDYAPTLISGHWALHRYLVDGRPKVHAVSTNRFPTVPSETRWQVVGLRACDPSEFDAADVSEGSVTVWRDATDDPVRVDVVSSHPGPGHCGWERTVFLSLGPDNVQYIRDPFGDLATHTVLRFDPDIGLPADAVDTGYHTDAWHLFTIPSGRAVFIRTADGTVERWPRARDQIGCA